MTDPPDAPQARLLRQLRAVLEQLRTVAATQPAESQPAWADLVAVAEELLQALQSGGGKPKPPWSSRRLTREQLQEFGKLLRDRRNAAGFSRVLLARKAKLSDATIKFAETAVHPPSRATLIRLIDVPELKLTWADAPGHPPPPAVRSEPPTTPDERPWLHTQLNCFLTPSYDPLAYITQFSRFLNGAGGHIEQSLAYLDPFSAAAYLQICHGHIAVTTLREIMPLQPAAQRIVEAIGTDRLQVLALGAGDGQLETRLVKHMLDSGLAGLELCLLDISQPLLSCAYQHAADSLRGVPNSQVWAVQCNFHELPLYTRIYAPAPPGQRRLFCLLGGTLANLDQEPQFLRHTLLLCAPGDLLLLDIPTACAPSTKPEEILRRDSLLTAGVSPQLATWLGGPLWRHCTGTQSVDFHFSLDTHCPVPGSYALHAIATVKAPPRGDRRFSMFRFTRYDPDQLAQCLREIGWDEIGALAYGGDHALRLYRRSDEITEAAALSCQPDTVTTQTEGQQVLADQLPAGSAAVPAHIINRGAQDLPQRAAAAVPLHNPAQGRSESRGESSWVTRALASGAGEGAAWATAPGPRNKRCHLASEAQQLQRMA